MRCIFAGLGGPGPDAVLATAYLYNAVFFRVEGNTPIKAVAADIH